LASSVVYPSTKRCSHCGEEKPLEAFYRASHTRSGWYPNANHAGLFLAQDRGYFADAGLEVELYTPSDPTSDKVVSVAALVQHPRLE